MTFKIFVRNWWKENPNWPGEIEPDPNAKKDYIDETDSEIQARKICNEWNFKHNPGKLSRKAEYEED